MSGAITPPEFALFSAGLFFLTGLITGVWKYVKIMSSPDHSAPVYVDIAHRSALLYAFACILMERFCFGNAFSANVVWVALVVPVFFFGTAVATYIRLGFRNRTDNQFRERNFTTTIGMWLLVVGEIGGFAALFVGWCLGSLLPA